MENEMIRAEVSRLRSFGQLVELQAARSIELLKVIDDTIYACSVDRDQLIELTGAALEYVQALKRVDRSIDKDGAALAKLEEGRDALAAAYEAHQATREAAASHPGLHEDDGVVEALDGLLDAMAAAHNAINDLCWALGEHEADFDAASERQYGNADDLIASLRG
jgi:hypothetical protein